MVLPCHNSGGKDIDIWQKWAIFEIDKHCWAAKEPFKKIYKDLQHSILQAQFSSIQVPKPHCHWKLKPYDRVLSGDEYIFNNSNTEAKYQQHVA